ncbi:protein CHROMATIN REMODELING 19 isoform X1 [Dendrobium catenatum]|uniref:CHD3-type chromatin-remodeling factor PICKLE n=1 Tax=Dendrobium catenatum TaxID=906689 RepID=A0A2I0XI43_9ASPA|nr:protein CHROMATIN REMODELING 19 isoform X1 [Dendrobium catenatum]PKU87575.1 CHD3-type chromatin-remodeling factor PICKLE [Dendrobium catenatum]
MRRAFDEISDEEWENHSFNPSKVLKKGRTSSSPSIESFAYRPQQNAFLHQNGIGSTNVVNLDDDDEDEDEEVGKRNGLPATRATRNSRGRRYVVDEDSDPEGWDDVIEVQSVEKDDDEEFSFGSEEEEEEEEKWEDKEFDVVGRALHKCSKISVDLRRELYGSSVSAIDRYAEVEASSIRIVTQDDIDEACSSEDLGFEPNLKPYQLVGVNFLLLLYRKKIGGAILADEMGLGKTVQAVTYLTLLKHLNDDPGPHLIVCPASVLENWERELKRWCPTFSVILFHGAGRAVYSKELSSMGKAGLPPPFNVMLSCYSLFERRSSQQKDDRKVLKRWQWSCIILDEAHVMKDKNSFRWKNLMSVAKGARQRLMLTGTPLQNDLHELWSLLEFMMPDIFTTGDIDLKKLLIAEDTDLIPRIKSILGPFILRRLKSDVMQQLVPKIQHVEYVVMGKEQSAAYNDAINDYRAASESRSMKSSVRTPNNVCSLFPSRQISNYFMQFRKIANHPLLVRRIYCDEDVVRIAKILYSKGVFGFECTVERAIQEINGYNDFSIHQLLLSYCDSGVKDALTNEHVLGSAKCQVLAELLPRLSIEGHRVLIFSQWTAMMDILEWALEVIGVTYRRLDGSTQVTERQTIVDTFNNDPSIFACLLSTRAGGQGLNLVGADTVIIHDMDFNPQMDRQAEDRCHRIGQAKPVTIYRLVTKGTVDENIYEIARRKLVLDAAVLESGTELENGNDVPQKTMGEILSSLLLV